MSRKNNKKGPKHGKGFAIFLGIVWAIYFVVIMINVFRIYNYEPSYITKAKYVFTYVSKEQYGTVASRMSDVLGYGIDLNKKTEYKELAAMSHYVDAATMYNLRKQTGDLDGAALYLSRMEEAKEELGILNYTAAEIDKMLGIVGP